MFIGPWKEWLCISMIAVTTVTKAVSCEGNVWFPWARPQFTGSQNHRSGAAWGCIIWWQDACGRSFSCGSSIMGSCEHGSGSHLHEMKPLVPTGRRGRVHMLKVDGWSNGHVERKTCGCVGMSSCWRAGAMNSVFQETTNWGGDSGEGVLGLSQICSVECESSLRKEMHVLRRHQQQQTLCSAGSFRHQVSVGVSWYLLSSSMSVYGAGIYIVGMDMKSTFYNQAFWVQIRSVFLVTCVNVGKSLTSLCLGFLSLIWRY